MAALGKPLAVLVALTLAAGCTDQKKKIAQAQKARAEAKKALEAADAAKRNANKPKIEPANLEPFWDDPSYLRVKTGRPCPEGMWALFPQTPGEGAEKEANERRRDELAAKIRASTFVAVLPFDTGVTLRKYNKKKKTLTVQVDGVMECFDGLGLLGVAWGEPAKAVRPGQPDDDEEEVSQQAVWRARPLLFPLPFATAALAQAFKESQQGIGLEARVVFTPGKVEVDTRAKEGQVDWGAGRLRRHESHHRFSAWGRRVGAGAWRRVPARRWPRSTSTPCATCGRSCPGARPSSRGSRSRFSTAPRSACLA